MVVYTKHVPLATVTSDANSTVVVDRTGKQPLKWFSIVVDNNAYIGINQTATTSDLELTAGEAYTTPEKVRIITINVLRKGTSNVTVRGSAWF